MKYCVKNRIKSYLACPFLMMAFLFTSGGGGCGGSGVGGGGGNENRPYVSLAVRGDLTAEQKDLMKKAGIELVAFDSRENIPILLTKEELWKIEEGGEAHGKMKSEANPEGFERAGHIVLLFPDSADVDELHRLLKEPFGHDGFRMSIDDGDSVIFYGMGTQIDDDPMVFMRLDSSEAPGAGNVIEDEEGLSVDVSIEPVDPVLEDYKALKSWLLYEDDVPRSSQTRNAAVSAKDGESPAKELKELAATYVTTLSASISPGGKLPKDVKKSVHINVCITPIHRYGDADGGRDWYFIEQECILDGSSGYKTGWEYTWLDYNGERYYVNGGRYILNYIAQYEVKDMLDLGGADVSNVILTHAKPEAKNTETSYTINQSYNVGAEVGGSFGKSEGKVEPKLSFGYSYESSKTYQTHDVTWVQHNEHDNNSPWWQYNLKGVDNKSGQYPDYPCELSHSVYSPVQTWIWGINSSARDKIKQFKLSLTLTNEAAMVRHTGAREPYRVKLDASREVTVNLPQPPLMGLEKNSIEYGRKAGTPVKPVRILAEGGWNAEITSGNDWFEVTTVPNKQLAVSFTENNTGKSRQGKIRITRNGSSTDSADIIVTQYATDVIDQ